MKTDAEQPAAGAAEENSSIPLSVPEIRGNEWKYVQECLDTGWVSSVGGYVERFEGAMADYVGCRRAVATVNGTAALHVALRVAGVEPDDEVLVSDLTFIAPVNAVRYLGAWPVLIDAEPDYWQMDPRQVADSSAANAAGKQGRCCNKATGRRVPRPAAGPHPWPSVDMAPLVELAREFDLVVVEDASESLGAKCGQRQVGSLGDISCFSYNGNKLITTGGGGMIVTDNEAWADKAKYLTTQAKDDPLEYVHGEIGYNYRLTNVLAALGVAQMEQIDAYLAAKRRIADFYASRLGGLPGIGLMPEAAWATSSVLVVHGPGGPGEIWHGEPRVAREAGHRGDPDPAAVAADPRESGLCVAGAAGVSGGRAAVSRRPEPALFGRNHRGPVGTGRPGHFVHERHGEEPVLTMTSACRTLNFLERSRRSRRPSHRPRRGHGTPVDPLPDRQRCRRQRD